MPPKAAKAKKPKAEKAAKKSADDEKGDEDFSVPATETIVPAEQLKLTPKELDEDITRVLTANDPNVPVNIVVYHFKDREYKSVPPGSSDNTVGSGAATGGARARESF